MVIEMIFQCSRLPDQLKAVDPGTWGPLRSRNVRIEQDEDVGDVAVDGRLHLQDSLREPGLLDVALLDELNEVIDEPVQREDRHRVAPGAQDHHRFFGEQRPHPPPVRRCTGVEGDQPVELLDDFPGSLRYLRRVACHRWPGTQA